MKLLNWFVAFSLTFGCAGVIAAPAYGVSPDKQVAAKLGLSAKTVEIHRATAMKKLGVSSLAELVRVASAALA